MRYLLAVVFGVLSGGAVATAVQSRILSGEAEEIDIASLCSCGPMLGRDVEYICDATTQISAPAANCTQWRLATNLALVDGACGNCTKVVEYVGELCQLQLKSLMVEELVPTTCAYATNLIGSACNDGCLVSPSFCSDYDSQEFVDCQSNCGDYFGCRCYQIKGGFNFQCYGATVSGTASCYDLLETQNPQVSSTCGTSSTCQPYFVCPTDRCLAFDIECQAPSDCFVDPGVCDPGTGICSFFEMPDGTPCNDTLFYTSNDRCRAGQCIGDPDRCLQYSVECSMSHNPCVGAGSCVPETGDCRFTKTAAGTVCDDGNPLTKDDQCNGKGVCKGTPFDPCEAVNCQVPPEEPCILAATCIGGQCVFIKETELKACGPDGGDNKVCAEGRCLAVADATKTFFISVGEGHCVDVVSGVNTEINYYFNDVNNEAECQTVCLNDPLCIGYSFMPETGRTCFIYAPTRTRSPLSFWTWRGARSGQLMGGVKSLGAVKQFCYRRSDSPPSDLGGFVAADYIVSPLGSVLLLLMLSGLIMLYIKVYFVQVNTYALKMLVKLKNRLYKPSTD